MDFVQETHMKLNRRYSKCPSHNGISLGGLCDKKYKFCLAALSSKIPLWFETMLVRLQISQQCRSVRAGLQSSCWWRPDILIMHFSFFYLDLSELASLVNLWCFWEHCGCTAGKYPPVVLFSLCTWALLCEANMRQQGVHLGSIQISPHLS